MRLFRTILKSKDEGISKKIMPRLTALFQIPPLRTRVAKDAVCFLGKMKQLAEAETTTENLNTSKVIKNERMLLWMVKVGGTRNALREAEAKRLTEKKIKDEMMREWTTRRTEEGLKRRKLPLRTWRKHPAIWQSKSLDGETTWLHLKWYIGEFPIPRRGARVPREESRKLEQLMEKNEAWKSGEEEDISRIVRSLPVCTLHNRNARENTTNNPF